MGEKIYGLLGRKLGHSWSVSIHQAFGCQDYQLIEKEPENLADFLAHNTIGGLNVTIPYKRDVIPFCETIDEDAKKIGSVNTLVSGPDGRLRGYNTDLRGFLCMARRAGVSFSGKKVLILGSGGASLTVQAAAWGEGAREVVVVSRSGPNNYENLDLHNDAQVLVNTTPVGMWPQMDSQPVDLTKLPRLEAVLDLIYNPLRTNLLLQAEKQGIPCSGGLPMLVDQAAAAEELFFGKAISSEETEKILSKLWRSRLNLVLVGMPGSGKTTIGQELAALSGRTLVDLDAEIVRRAGKSIPEIFRKEGENTFRDLEQQVLEDYTAQSGWIIATGGGAVLRSENRTAMRRTGRVYFLRRELKQLPTDGRPLSQKGSLEEMYRLRLPMYTAAADLSVDNNAAALETAKEIWRDFCAYSGNERA